MAFYVTTGRDNATYNGDSNSATAIGTALPDWMSTLPDSAGLNLADLSIPGTHDSMALHNYVVLQAETQTTTIYQQLMAGVRYFDIRAFCEDLGNGIYSFASVHGPTSQYGSVEPDVLVPIQAFLKQHPGETVLMRFSRDGATNKLPQETCHDPDPTGPGCHTSMGFAPGVDYLLKKYPDLFYGNPFGKNPVAWQSSTPVPSLAAARNHIVLLQGWGDPGPPCQRSVYVYYTPPASTNQWNSVDNYDNQAPVIWAGDEPHLNLASGQIAAARAAGIHNTTMFLTGLNGSVAVTGQPYNIANGSCTGQGYCFPGTNYQAMNWMLGHPGRPAGVLAADYPGPGLLDTIVAQNFINLLPGPNGLTATAADEISDIVTHVAPQLNSVPSGYGYHSAEVLSEGMYSWASGAMPTLSWVTQAWHGGADLTVSTCAVNQAGATTSVEGVGEWMYGQVLAPGTDNWGSYFQNTVLPGTRSQLDVNSMRQKMEQKFPRGIFGIFRHADPGGGSNWWLQSAPNVPVGEFHYKHNSYFVAEFAKPSDLQGVRGRGPLTFSLSVPIETQPTPTPTPAPTTSTGPVLAATGAVPRVPLAVGVGMVVIGVVLLLATADQAAAAPRRGGTRGRRRR
jgi:hypothetical protein